MSAASPRYAIVEAPAFPAGGRAFVRAALGRVRPVHALWWLAIFALVRAFGPVGLLEFPIEEQLRWWKPALLVDGLAVAGAMLGVLAGDEAVARGARRLPSYAIGLAAGGCLAASLQLFVRSPLHWWPDGMPLEDFLMQAPQIALDVFMFGAIGCFVYVNRRTARLALERMQLAEVGRARARKRTLESQLQAMQARVEPQFLFNTLAQVRDLYEHDATLAGRVLDDLIAYLRAALPQLRESTSTLGQEVELARAYLDIMKVRSAGRLDSSIDVPDEAKGARLPPMLVLPLLDHALAPGGEPSRRSIRIGARSTAGRLTLTIADSGLGFAPGQPSEVLAGIAERLSALYGERARFALSRMDGGGTVATIEIAHEEGERPRDAS